MATMMKIIQSMVKEGVAVEIMRSVVKEAVTMEIIGFEEMSAMVKMIVSA